MLVIRSTLDLPKGTQDIMCMSYHVAIIHDSFQTHICGFSLIVHQSHRAHEEIFTDETIK